MKHIPWLFESLLLLVSFAGAVSAQTPNDRVGPALRLPVPPMRIIERYFELTPDQVEQIKGFMETRKAAVEPLAKQIAEKEKELRDLLGGANPDPAQVGNVAVAIHQLREQISKAQDQSDTELEGILTPDQLTRLHAVRKADRLEPVVRAMRELRLGLP